MTILIDSDLVSLMKHDSYISDIVNCEIDKMYTFQEKYTPVNLHLQKLDIKIITMLDKEAYRTAYIRLVI